MHLRTALALALMALPACGPSSGRRPPDQRGDGGLITSDDPNLDKDGDGVTPAGGDCNDGDPSIYPGSPELCDGKDHDCDGVADDICDDDKDGYALKASDDGKIPGGDCNDQDPLVNPGAIEVAGDMVDNNCDGKVDEPLAACDGKANNNDPNAFAGAIELCGPWVMGAKLSKDADPKSRAIKTSFGNGYKPMAGGNFIMLSTGVAGDMKDPGYVAPRPGTEFANDDPNPSPMANKNACFNGPDEMTVHDYAELTLTLKVPTNAKSFTFNFMFVSTEYPEFVGSEYNDKFVALLDSKSFKGNVSFDSKMNPITVNAGFFDVCTSAKVCGGMMMNVCTKPIAQLAGTGFGEPYLGKPNGGGTGWLKTTSPVTPGETATLRFIIFDEGDHILDSAVIIDNFQWQGEPSTGPSTVG